MKLSLLSRRQALGLLAACAVRPGLATPAGDRSIYALSVPMTDQNGRDFQLANARGEPVLVSMFYSSCDAVCPMIFETLKLTLAQLPAALRQRVRVVMVSFDPVRDTVPVLKQTAQTRQVDDHWTLARPSEADARKVAALLGVQYRRLASGEFNHSSNVLLLDAEGQIAWRSNTLGAVDAKLVQSLRKLLAS